MQQIEKCFGTVPAIQERYITRRKMESTGKEGAGKIVSSRNFLYRESRWVLLSFQRKKVDKIKYQVYNADVNN